MTHPQSALSIKPVLRSGLITLALLTGATTLCAAPETPAKTKPAATAQAQSEVHAKVNINTASADELSNALKGVGPAKAQAIIDYRTQYGPFKSVEELAEVKGIGPSTLEKNAGLIVLK